MFFALILIIIGAVFLLNNLGVIAIGSWSLIWPLLLIGFGLYLAVGVQRFRNFRRRLWEKCCKRDK